VRYKPNRFCIDSGPRTMSLAMPAVSEDGDLEDEPNAPLDTERALARALSSRVVDDEGAHVSTFKNRSPIWDERYQAYVLNFMGRVRIASVKNFQIVQQDNVANETLLQFGRVSSTVFSMDVQWPLSIVQAFGVCLTSISTKLGVK
jgi:tubby-related protein 1